MKKSFIVMLTCIAIIITFIFTEIFSIYHFGTIPALLTFLYIISIFSILEYLFIVGVYIVRKIIKKDRLETKMIIALFLLFVALLLILMFFITIDVDWLNWYLYSTPFYINVIVRSIEFLVPAVLFIIVSVIFMKRNK